MDSDLNEISGLAQSAAETIVPKIISYIEHNGPCGTMELIDLCIEEYSAQTTLLIIHAMHLSGSIELGDNNKWSKAEING